jgi:hypothetical protein
MAFKIWPLTAEVILVGDHGGDPRITVLHYRHGATQPVPTTADLNELCEEIRDTVMVDLLNCCNAGTRWTAVRAVYHGNSSAIQGSVFLGPLYVGARPGDPLSGNVNVCFAKHGASALDRAQGRLFVPDLVEQDQADNVLVYAPTLTNLTLLAAELLTSRTTTNHSWRLVVASRKYSSTSDVQSITFGTLLKGLNTRRKGYHKHKRAVSPL